VPVLNPATNCRGGGGGGVRTVEIIFNLWRGLCRGKNGEVDCNLYHKTVGEH
jgi:hypothetical protein